MTAVSQACDDTLTTEDGEGTSCEPATGGLPTQNDAVATSKMVLDEQPQSPTVEPPLNSEPFHVESSQVPCQKLSTKTLYFQDSWYKRFPWLHFNTEKRCMLCFYCSNVCTDPSLPWTGNKQPAFTSDGFFNWKKGPAEISCVNTRHPTVTISLSTTGRHRQDQYPCS